MLCELYNVTRQEHIAWFKNMNMAEVYVECLRLFRDNDDSFLVLKYRHNVIVDEKFLIF